MVTESPGINSHTSSLTSARLSLPAAQLADPHLPPKVASKQNHPNQQHPPLNQQQNSLNKAPDQQPSTPLGAVNSTPASTHLASPKPAEEQTTEEQTTEEDKAAASADELNAVLDEINNSLYSMNRALRFEINDTTEDLVVRVVNTDTDQIIHQYPSEEVIKRKERLLEGEVSGFSVRVD